MVTSVDNCFVEHISVVAFAFVWGAIIRGVIIHGAIVREIIIWGVGGGKCLRIDQKNCPLDNFSLGNCPPDNCPLDNCPPDNCPPG